MSDLDIRRATLADIPSVLEFWRLAAEGTSISDDHDGVARLIARAPRPCSSRSASEVSPGA